MNDNPQKEVSHPKPRYFAVLAALVVLTGIEVAISYLPENVKIPLLIVIAVAKASLVVLWFMHLKFDSRLFAVVFLLGLLLIIPELIVLGVATPFNSPTP